jgi:hypothetical protein
MIITPAQAIDHLRASEDDEAMILLYAGAAEQSAMNYINRKVFQDAETLSEAVLTGTGGTLPIVADDAIRAAILLTLGHLYANREDSIIGVSAVELPMGSQWLLAPYRIGMGA